MKRAILVDMAWMQLNEARENRRQAMLYELGGHEWQAKAYRSRAATCLRCAKLFQHDANTEELETLHMERRP